MLRVRQQASADLLAINNVNVRIPRTLLASWTSVLYDSIMRDAERTRKRLLDACEASCISDGFAGLRLRAVAAAARQPLSAIAYHFGRREALIAACIHRRFAPVHEQRLAWLDRLEAEYGDALPLDRLLEPFIDPLLHQAGGERDGARIFQLMCQAMTQPQYCSDADRALLQRSIERFCHAFHRCLPQLGARELSWRIHFVIGMIVHSLRQWHESGPGRRPESDDLERLARHLRHAAHAVLNAKLQDDAPHCHANAIHPLIIDALQAAGASA